MNRSLSGLITGNVRGTKRSTKNLMSIIAIAVTAIVVSAASLLAAVKIIKHNRALAARIDALESKIASTVVADAKKL